MSEPSIVVIPIPEFHFLLDETLEEKCIAHNSENGTKYVPRDFLPTRAEVLSTGWDVRCAEFPKVDLRPGNYFAFRPNGRLIQTRVYFTFVIVVTERKG